MLQPSERSATPERTASGFAPAQNPFAKTLAAPGEQATIGRSIVIKGEISGGEALYVDGRVEGTISLPESKVTVGRNGHVVAHINAKEVVVMGKVEGDLSVSDRVDIRSEGSVTGDITAQRLTIEDGAFMKGGIDLGKSGKGGDASKKEEKPAAMAAHA